ncbi:MAG: hypothetical protein AAF961_17845, partial [Planctomycetota bacterium]
MRELEHASISHSHGPPRGCALLPCACLVARIPNFQRLALWKTFVGDEGALHIATLTSLKELSILSPRLSDR